MDCQKLSWKLTYRYACVPIMVPPEKEEALEYYGRVIKKWLNVWRDHLNPFAIMAARTFLITQGRTLFIGTPFT